jgi:isochorismate synthase
LRTELKYRIPHQEKIERTGKFVAISTFDNVQGFVVSSFDKKQQYVFLEGEVDSIIDYKTTPVSSMDKSHYCDIATKFLTALQKNNISKAIFSRVKTVNQVVDPNDLFENLCSSYPNAFVYLISSPLFGTWVGATPEVLVSADNNIGSTVALAGTLNASSEMPWGEKEKLEQLYVEQFVEDRLKSLQLQSLIKSNVHEVIAGPVKHLCTSFDFELNNCSVAHVVNELHPTPAVSGLPQEMALELIQQFEPHQRELYAGFIGVIGTDTSNVYVNLRCAKIEEEALHLFVGGGFTADSDVEKEWMETEIKAETILNVLQKR